MTGATGRWGPTPGPVQAILVDAYLDDLLAAGERRAADVPADAALDPATRTAAVRLRRDLVRFHPSFRFEERLAARLAELAAQMRLPAAAGAEGTPWSARTPLRALPDPELQAIAEGRVDPSAPEGGIVPREVLIRGAVASAALSLAGVAIVAWRASRPSATPMARAVRAARRARDTGPLGVGRGRPAAWRRAGRRGRAN